MSPIRTILFIQGGGEGTHDEWDNKLVDTLRMGLGGGDSALRACHQPRPSQGKRDDPRDAHDRERRDRGLRRTRRQHELEERHGIAPLHLHPPDGAVPVADDKRRSLDTQESDASPEPTTSPSHQH